MPHASVAPEDHGPALDDRDGAREGGAERRVLHLSEAVPERGLLQRDLFPSARDSAKHVHRHLRRRAVAGMDIAVVRDGVRARG